MQESKQQVTKDVFHVNKRAKMALYRSPDYQINWHFAVQKKKCKINFQDGGHGGYLKILIGTILALFLSTSHSDASDQVWSQLAFQFRRRSEKYIFKIAAMVAILDFRLE